MKDVLGTIGIKANMTKKPKITNQNKQITVSKLNEPYKYLGKLILINSEDPCQFEEIISTYKDIVEKIRECQLPLTFKVCALNNMALLKVLHYFSNTRFQNNLITDVGNYLTDKVRSLFMLYKSNTKDVIFLSRSHGFIGVKLFFISLLLYESFFHC